MDAQGGEIFPDESDRQCRPGIRRKRLQKRPPSGACVPETGRLPSAMHEHSRSNHEMAESNLAQTSYQVEKKRNLGRSSPRGGAVGYSRAISQCHPMTVADQTAQTPLSARECEVLIWLANGKSAPVVSAILRISVSTVRMHIRSIIEKMMVSNIPHAVARGFHVGILRAASSGDLDHKDDHKDKVDTGSRAAYTRSSLRTSRLSKGCTASCGT